MRKSLKLLIFDCDGVLFNSKEANRAYYNHILNHFGKFPMSESDLDFVHMHTAEESIKYLFRDDTEKLEATLKYRKKVDYQNFLHLLKMEPGLKEFITLIRPPLKTAISTNRTNTMKSLTQVFGLDRYFDLIVSALDSPQPKPHPESVLVILDHFHVNPNQCLYIGDTMVDRQVSQSTGIKLVAYKNPRLPAEYHINSFQELCYII
jgi:phosphoglycolate phosphatase